MLSTLASRRGGSNLEHEGYIYNLKRQTKDGNIKAWVCQKKNSLGCKATAKTEGTVVIVSNEHCHLPSAAEVEVQKKLHEVYSEALINAREAPQSLILNVMEGVSDNVAAKLPKFESIQQNVARKRKQNGVSESPIETNLADLMVSENMKKLSNGERFLYFDSGPDDSNRFIIFATSQSLETLKNCNMISVDGTFDSCPKVFDQLWSIHGFIHDSQVPLVYCFLPNRSTTTYISVLLKLMEYSSNMFENKIVLCDFEAAEHGAFKDIDPTVTIQGCYFHHLQALWRNVQRFHLEHLYNNGVALKRFFAMPMVPLEHVLFAYEEASAGLLDVEDSEEVHQFLEYYEKTWTGYTYRKRFKHPRYPIAMWNVYEASINGCPRTNNRTEAWHRSLGNIVRISKPGFYFIVEELKRQEEKAQILKVQLLSGQVVYRKPSLIAKDARIKNVAENFDKVPVLEYLEHVVLDYTGSIPTPPRRLSTSSTSSNSSISPPPLLSLGRIHLLFCVTAYGELIGAMSRLTLVDRRSLDTVELNSKELKDKCTQIQATKDNGTGGSKDDSSYVRLNIRIYSEPTYDESSFVGFVRIPLDPETFLPIEKTVGANWYEIKTRMTISQNTTVIQQPSTSSSTNNLSTSQYDALDTLPSTSTINTTTTTTTTNIHGNGATEKVGDLRIRFWYSVEHILALNHYQPLYEALMASLDSQPYDISLTSILQHLPIDLGHIARPLMKIFLKHDLFDSFFRLVCTQYVSTSNETSTLFRNQSMASKLMHEMMKFVGNDYLVSTLKPVIDLVYAEKKRCEIDPTKLRSGESLEENTRNFAVYAELAFVRVCESAPSCPPLMKSVFGVLREVVNERYPNRTEVSRLAVSSFIIMRFFASAIINPTQNGLKRKAPEPDVSRTLVLISKILQRLANCVVTHQPLITKEPWLSSVLERFFDDGHRQEMVEFFDSLSLQNYQPSSTPLCKPDILKSGSMLEKRSRSNRRRSLKDIMPFQSRKRIVTLTQKELSWQREKKDDKGEGGEQKGVIPLSEITSVTQISENKPSFRVATPHQEVLFQANTNGDMTDWMILLITLQRRHLFFHNRPSSKTKSHHHIDMEKELETLHLILVENIGVLMEWKEAVQSLKVDSDIGSGDKFPYILFQKIKSTEERKQLQDQLLKILTNVISAIQAIESVHQTAELLAKKMQNLQNSKSDKLDINGFSDNENYLLMRGRDRFMKSKAVPSA